MSYFLRFSLEERRCSTANARPSSESYLAMMIPSALAIRVSAGRIALQPEALMENRVLRLCVTIRCEVNSRSLDVAGSGAGRPAYENPRVSTEVICDAVCAWVCYSVGTELEIS